jgi:hypothetical protein
VLAIIIGPVLFYIPRFFEIVTVYKTVDVPVNCSSLMPSIPVIDIPCAVGACHLKLGI